ncbi:hypothetical protein P5673_022310 [Acropora cervicornis]|uniref:PHD-type domain-containing protein n=1 Tax=Acropora cervicornis TaxID=6130 RepID=A0AAD9Q6N8_ACRCE|nr:hypothetical protein P5673_022310 [Acropora cervicornis]
MSEDNADGSKTEKFEQKDEEDSAVIPLLSEYSKKLDSRVKRRYIEKISVIDTSYYTAQQFKAFKSLEAYNQMVTGFITCVQGKVIAGKYVVLAKVRHSQRMNDPPIPIWVIASQEGTIISAHCMGCKAGLGETCSHVASVLFYIEAWTRINGKMACTQVKCAWLLPTYVNEVPYARARDINFKSAKKLKEEMDLKIDAVGDNQSEPPAPARNIKTSNMSVRPLDEDEMNAQLKKLNDLTVNLDLNDSELCAIEADTRKQFKGNLFFRHRAGRIGASVSWAVAHSNPMQPSQSLIKSLCYPHLFRVTSKAITHGKKYEKTAVETYVSLMSQTHKDFQVKYCGMIVDKEHPWLHATPDFMASCSCCGDGCGELKCPYGIKNGDFENYISKTTSCLEKVNGEIRLKRNHQYYYQVQQQLNITKLKYCDFVVFAFNVNNQPVIFYERIYSDFPLWESLQPKLTKFWRICILPEILGRWYTRKCHMPSLVQVPVSCSDNIICYCRKATEEETITCSNPKCPYMKFHLSCLRSSDQIPKIWYCPTCRLLPEFKRNAKTRNAIEQDICNKAFSLNSVCICNSKPRPGDRLLECHSEDCLNGKFFHLDCLKYKRMPNNSKSTWICNSCKEKPIKASDVNISTVQSGENITSSLTSLIPSTTCTSSIPQDPCGDVNHSVDYLSIRDSDDDYSDAQCDSNDDLQITKVCHGNIDKTASLGNLTQAEYAIIESPNGWLDCTVIQEAHILLKQVNPMIKGFQRTTLGPARNFDVVTSEFVQILHTGNHHWVCASSVGCLPGTVNLYDSLFHDIIANEVEEQLKDLMANNLTGINIVAVQQQGNGSDCGVFSIAFATCIVYGRDPGIVTFDVPQMRPHLSQCLNTGLLSPFPQI